MDFAGLLEIAPLQPRDMPALSLVATAAYACAYAGLWADPARLARRLARFSPPALQAWVDEPGVRVLAAKLDGALVGYLGLRLGSADPVQCDPAAAELHRVYLLPNAVGGGIGRALLEAAEAIARADGAPALWLRSMVAAPARKAYARFGFEVVGEDVLDNDKPELSAMVVLAKALRS